MMTQAQINAVTRIQQYCFGRVPEEKRDTYEVKKLRVEEWPKSVFVFVVFGKKDDEGTLASVFARSRGMFRVGPRGAIKALYRPEDVCSTEEYRPTARQIRDNPLIYGWAS